MSSSIPYSENNFERVYLVGVRLSGDSHEPEVYTLVLYNEVGRNDANRPLTYDGRLVFFRSVVDANRALSLGDAAFKKYRPISTDVSYVYDLPLVLGLVAGSSTDAPGVIADFINELLDFVAATRWKLPEHHRSVLFGLADHSTFDKQLDAFLGDSNRRTEACNALLWCVGAVLSRAYILPEE